LDFGFATEENGKFGISAARNRTVNKLVPAEGSLITKSMTTKNQITEILDKYEIPYRKGRAKKDNTGGDNLEQLRKILDDWLVINAKKHNIIVGVTRVQQLCRQYGHFDPLMTPPYHPELQPIEDLWRDVKQYVARKYMGGRTMSELFDQVKEAFTIYGNVDKCQGKINEALRHEARYVAEGVYAPVIDLTTLEDTDISTSIDDGDVSDDEEIDDYVDDNDSDDEDNH
jgi:transposase